MREALTAGTVCPWWEVPSLSGLLAGVSAAGDVEAGAQPASLQNPGSLHCDSPIGRVVNPRRCPFRPQIPRALGSARLYGSSGRAAAALLGAQSWQRSVSPQYGKEHKICSLWNQVQDLTLEGLFNML